MTNVMIAVKILGYRATMGMVHLTHDAFTAMRQSIQCYVQSAIRHSNICNKDRRELMSLKNQRINIQKLRDLAANNQAPTLREVRAALAEIGGLETKVADLEDLAYNRAPKTMAEEANKKLAELEARLVEAERVIGFKDKVITALEARAEKAEGEASRLRGALVDRIEHCEKHHRKE